MPSEIVTGKTSSDIENVDWSTGTVAGPHYANVVRFGSSSSQASQSSGDICRICHCESDPQNPLLTPCYCSGSLKYVHQACLQQWLTASETNACELCKFPFIMHTKIKPFNEWRSLDMSGVERRRLCCAVLFHCAAALCVIWSLCVLIERAAEEVKRGLIGWPFWTKLAVVTVGLTGGVVFMYIQCRQYLHLCHRWRARNRILLIQNAPEKIHPLSPPSPVLNSRHIPRNNSATAASAMTTNSFNYNSYGGGVGCYSSSSATVAGCGGVGVGGIGGNRSSASITQQNTSNYSSHGPLHNQIIANIENNSQNYDRDWTLDDVSQISSFRPCQQGSGSMTPFHDSVHNVLENSRSCSNSISSSKQDISNAIGVEIITSTNNGNRTNNLDLFKTSSTITPSKTAAGTTSSSASASATTTKNIKYPNSSVFLENQDILNDVGYPKINYRHSSVLMSPDISDNLDKFLGKDLRRYSDTKLLQSDTDLLNSVIFNVSSLNSKASNSNFNHNHHTINDDEYHQQCQPLFQQQQQQQSQHHYHHNQQRSSRNCTINETPLVQHHHQQQQQHQLYGGGAPQITDIIFENTAQYDPIDLNIQEIFDNTSEKKQQYHHQQQQYKNKSRHSLNAVNTSIIANESEQDNDNFDKTRLFFKSLPNLSNSCESLIKK